jgi:serine/threonine-protein kinase
MTDAFDRLKSELADRYAIEQEIGSGGMATVYLAEDLKLHRMIALKVLRPEFAASLGSDRFLQEIDIAAKLNHPHIIGLHECGEADGFLYYAMPYIEGESLRDRLAREGPLPLEDALQITREVASALDYAHTHGVIHRDIKPENILLSAGEAVVADFGVARALSMAGGTRITKSGIALGTPAYMSPEQATGDRETDPRTDIYGLATVLYEMLTGDPPHTGSTAQAIIAKVVTDHPRPVRELRETAPVHVEAALDRALAKLPADRYASVRLFLDALEGRIGQGVTAEATPRAPQSVRQWSTWVNWRVASLVCLLILAAGFLLGRVTKFTQQASVAPMSFSIELPADRTVAPEDLAPLALSPNGRRLVFVGRGDGGTRLYLREMSGHDIVPIPGTEGAIGPFFSPDGEWIGFFAAGSLKKVAVSGGAPVDLAYAVLARGAAWGADNTILFTSAPGTGLWRVSALGGTPEIATTLNAATNDRTHRLPDISPDGRAALFTSRTRDHASFDATTVAVLSTETGRYVPMRHVVFVRAGALHAVPFDYTRQQVTGQPITVLDSVMTDPSTGAAHYAVSATGTLAYVRGGAWVPERQLLWAGFDGGVRPLSDNRRAFRSPRFSPDGAKVAVVAEAASDDIWVFDLHGGTQARLTFESSNVAPLWSPTGEQIAFSSNRGGPYNLYVTQADGTGSTDRLTSSAHVQFLDSWHSDGSVVAFTQNDPETGNDVWLLTLDGSGAQLLLGTAFNEYGAAFSPDGNWLAYTSDETGRDEIYAQPFPGTGGMWQVSAEGGRQPTWAPDGRVLYYRSRGRFVAVELGTRREFTAGRPRQLVDLPVPLDEGTVTSVRNYDVAPDGGGIVVVRAGEYRAPTRIHVILNWVEELRSRMATSGR